MFRLWPKPSHVSSTLLHLTALMRPKAAATIIESPAAAAHYLFMSKPYSCMQDPAADGITQDWKMTGLLSSGPRFQHKVVLDVQGAVVARLWHQVFSSLPKRISFPELALVKGVQPWRTWGPAPQLLVRPLTTRPRKS